MEKVEDVQVVHFLRHSIKIFFSLFEIYFLFCINQKANSVCQREKKHDDLGLFRSLRRSEETESICSS